jgi:AraC-like DNA-binding protein
VFHSGRLCGTARFDDDADGVGHLHVLRGGAIDLVDRQGVSQRLDAPTLLFFPRPLPHRLVAPESAPAELVCASIAFGAGGGDPLSAALPNPVVLPLADAPALASVLDLLFDEAFAEICGRAVALDRLAELLILHLLRHLLSAGEVRSGLLAGLADPRLSKVLIALHAAPAEPWSLERMAQAAGMSRARFAVHFPAVLGQTPMEYVTQWRLGLAMAQLRRGRAVKQVAHAVGYATASALARVFAARLGCSPLAWLARQTG